MDQTVKTRDFATTNKRPLDEVTRSYTRPPNPPERVDVRAPYQYKPVNVQPPRPFTDCDIAFAIDISQSTRGSVLAEECAIIENFAEGLTPRARERLRVMPWDEIPHSIIPIEELPKIVPGGRTDPNVLLGSKEQIDLLQNCHL